MKLTERQREAASCAVRAMLAGEANEGDWPEHVTSRDLEGAQAKLDRGRGTPRADPLAVAARGIGAFVDHRGGCAFIDGPAGSTCNCGLDEAQEALFKALADP